MKTKSITEKNIKVCLVGSSGGHLTHLYMLKPFWKDKNRFWVTFDKEDTLFSNSLQPPQEANEYLFSEYNLTILAGSNLDAIWGECVVIKICSSKLF